MHRAIGGQRWPDPRTVSDRLAGHDTLEDGCERWKTRRLQVFALPAHPDVPAGLMALRDAGFRLFTLSNTPREASLRQLEHAGIRSYFEDVFSATMHSYSSPGEKLTGWH
ncbi:HAD family hydrolase [Deinococcus sp. UYEF24]